MTLDFIKHNARIIRLTSIFIVALIVFIAPQFLDRYWTFFFGALGITIILATSLNLAIGYTGLVSIVHSGLYGVGAYTVAILVKEFGWSPWIALSMGVIAAAFVGAIISLTTVRVSHLYFAIVTLAFNAIIVEVIRESRDLTGGQIGIFSIPRPALGAEKLDDRAMYYLIWLGVLFSLWSLHNLVDNSRYGRSFRALKSNEPAAIALGINPLGYKMLSFSLSAGMAGFAGVLFAYLNQFISPQLVGLEFGLELFVAVLLGGSGTLLGPILGVVFLASVREFIKDYAQYQQLLFGSVLIATMFLIPKGIWGELKAFYVKQTSKFNPDDINPTISDPADYLDPATIRSLLELDNNQHQIETGKPILEAQGVVKSFGGLQALRGVDLAVNAGTIHGLIGPNGSGKSTLINCLTSSMERNEGSIVYANQNTPRYAYRVAKSGMVRVFQIPHLFGDMTVKENILTGFHGRGNVDPISYIMGLPYARREEAEMQRIADRLLEVAGLQDKAEMQANLLPHGQQRLLEVLRALTVSPSLLILDEPATGLVTREVQALGHLLEKLRDSGITILLIEHNMAFVMSVCDRVTVLEEGEKIAEGTPTEVQHNQRVIAAYLGESVKGIDIEKTMQEAVERYA
ncbi:MAG: branched-chain amino acid ABC transporter ATP-binding protein/permease [Aggregatilineales bacterium]